MDVIDKYYAEGLELLSFFKEQQEISFLYRFEEIFRKSLLLAIASYFEHEITEAIIKFATSKAESNEMLLSLVKNKAINRQYHTYFQWDDNNANCFFSLFGPALKEKTRSEINNDTVLRQAMKSFLRLGNARNMLVHKNYSTTPLDMTAEEIFSHYVAASSFVIYIKQQLI